MNDVVVHIDATWVVVALILGLFACLIFRGRSSRNSKPWMPPNQPGPRPPIVHKAGRWGSGKNKPPPTPPPDVDMRH